jgi:capsid protein
MKNWIPERLLSHSQESRDREEIVRRSVDLSQNDPNAAGVVDSCAATVIGSGLNPYPSVDWKLLGINKEQARKIQRFQRAAYDEWSPWADAGERMNFGQIQYQTKNHIIRVGEYFVICRIRDDPLWPFSLALMVINPLRVKTPVDRVSDSRIRDGVELGENGQPLAYWVKKNTLGSISGPDTAVLTCFIEDHTGDPWDPTDSFRTDQEPRNLPDESTKKIFYEETWPGRILYGHPTRSPTFWRPTGRGLPSSHSPG